MGALQEAAQIDESFIVPIEHRPTPSNQSQDDNIPVIDLSTSDIPSLVSQIGKACEDWGFFQATNHGLSLQSLANVRAESAKFFALPIEERRKTTRDFQNPLGYYDTELTKNTRDWKLVFDFVPNGSVTIPVDYENDGNVTTIVNRWPDNPEGLKNACERYAREVEGLCFRLLGFISMSLGLSREYFDGFFKDPTSLVRLNYYPPCPSPDACAITVLAMDENVEGLQVRRKIRVLGVSRHKDACAITVLAMDENVEGLQVRRKRDGAWVPVKGVAGGLVINVGDCMQVWSNDKYESVEHRVVVNEQKERYSIPFFFSPSHYVMMKPVSELAEENNVPKYKEFNWGKFLKRRNDSNFKHLGAENLQIHDFYI